MPFNLSNFIEACDPPDWLTHNSAWIYHIPMVPVFIKLLRPRVFVELGTFRGDSYMSFCQAVAKIGTSTQCTAVDTWEGDAHAGFYPPQIYEDLKAHHDPRYGHFSRLKKALFDAAVTDFADNSIDLLHIDGLHTYEAVKHDFETWLPKLTSRGVVLFHDTFIRERGFGVWQLWDEISKGRPHFNVPYGCGLGILAVGPEVPPPFLEFLADLNADHTRILPQFFALGHRNELLRNNMALVSKLHDSQEMINQWRNMTGQPIRNPTPAQKQAWDKPIEFALKATQDICQLTTDAVNLMTEVTNLRKVVKNIHRSRHPQTSRSQGDSHNNHAEDVVTFCQPCQIKPL